MKLKIGDLVRTKMGFLQLEFRVVAILEKIVALNMSGITAEGKREDAEDILWRTKKEVNRTLRRIKNE